MSGALLSVRDVADRTNLSEWAIRRAIRDGQLPAYKPRGRLRVDEADMQAWLEGTRVRPAVDIPRIPRIPARRQRTMDLSEYRLT